MAFDLATAWNNEWNVNGLKARKKLSDFLNESSQTALDGVPITICPYCSNRLQKKLYKKFDSEVEEIIGNDTEDGEWGPVAEPEFEHPVRHYQLICCTYCSFWKFNGYEGGNDCMNDVFLMSAASVLSKFSTEIPNGCSTELAQHLRRNPTLWHSLNPTRMETLVADIFRANHKNCEVKHVGGPGDLGIDVIFVDNNSTKWLIQVKRRERPNKAEGFSTLQSILGTLALQGERHGIIVSTADYFSHQLRKQKENASEKGYNIELIDKGILNRMVGQLLPKAPWQEIFGHPALDKTMRDIKGRFMTLKPDSPSAPEIDPNQLSLF